LTLVLTRDINYALKLRLNEKCEQAQDVVVYKEVL